MHNRPAPPFSSWCDIHLDRVSHNLERALSLVPAGVEFCAVLKADAYGHGIAQTVPLMREQGITCIGITSNAEARAVRAAGFTGRLIRLRTATLSEIEDACSDHVEEQVAALETALHLRNLAEAGTFRTGIHLTLNAMGMSRDGLEVSTPEGQAACLEILQHVSDLTVGISGHYPSNEPVALRHSAATFHDQASWVIANSALRRSDLRIHAGSSLTLIAEDRPQTDMYRCGAILYGILRPDLGFRPTLTLRSRVVSVQDYPSGAPVGYDGARHLAGARRLACISIGYANGFHRSAFARSAVVIRDQLAPVVGKISMNTLTVDATQIGGVSVGDIVTIFGEHPAFSEPIQTTEQQFSTIAADLFADWGQRNDRQYRQCR